MSAIMNGMALHGGLLPFGGTLVTFFEYARNAFRMATLIKQWLTHDFIDLGYERLRCLLQFFSSSSLVFWPLIIVIEVSGEMSGSRAYRVIYVTYSLNMGRGYG
jgi:hypothetical protein